MRKRRRGRRRREGDHDCKCSLSRQCRIVVLMDLGNHVFHFLLNKLEEEEEEIEEELYTCCVFLQKVRLWKLSSRPKMETCFT